MTEQTGEMIIGLYPCAGIDQYLLLEVPPCTSGHALSSRLRQRLELLVRVHLDKQGKFRYLFVRRKLLSRVVIVLYKGQ